jgi:hypothetical protein
MTGMRPANAFHVGNPEIFTIFFAISTYNDLWSGKCKKFLTAHAKHGHHPVFPLLHLEIAFSSRLRFRL